MVERENVVALDRFMIEQVADRSAANKMLFYDFRHVLRLYLAVKGALGVDDHNRTERAESETSGCDDLDFVCDAGSFQLRKESILDRHGV